MPERAQANVQVVALALLISAIAMGIVAGLIFVRTIPVEEASRPLIALAVGAAAFADLLVALWFFRKGQSS